MTSLIWVLTAKHLRHLPVVACVAEASMHVMARLARGGLHGQLAAVVAVAAAWFLAMVKVVFGHLRDEEAASRIVNVAGRQRMLTQRIARHALALAGGDTTADDRLAAAAAEFQQTLSDLLDGTSVRGLPESKSVVREQLLVVAHRWPEFAVAVDALRRRQSSSPEFAEALTFLSEHADGLMADSDEVVARLDEQFARRVRRLHRQVTIVGLGGGVLLAGTYATLSTNTRRRAERAEADVCHKEDELAERAEERRDLVRRLLGASEDERRRVAADLHDGPTQELTGAAMLLEAALQDAAASEGTLARISTARTYLEDAIDEMRRIIADLRPPLLDDLGIADALRRSLQPASEDFGIEVAIDASLTGPRPDTRTEVALYRVAHEAVMNAFKHSGAERVDVRLSEHDGCFLLDVHDRGYGFEPSSAMSRSGSRPLGLLGMRERVELMGGVLTIESSPGNGTIIHVKIPAGAGQKTP